MRNEVTSTASPDASTAGRTAGSRGRATRDGVYAVAAAQGALVATLVLGFVLRLIAALRLSPHVDEAASILAANVVSERLLPILPSGTVYFQGYTLSLLLAPFVWLGLGSLDDLQIMRLVPLAAGTASVYLTYILSWRVSGLRWVGVIAALLIALDPVSVQWSGHVRMYAILQLIGIGLAWVVIDMLARGVTWRRGVAAVLLSWLAVFTHIGAALLVLSIVLVALIAHGRHLLRDVRLLAVLFASCLAPVVLLAMNRVLGAARVVSDEERSSFLSFVGDAQVRPAERFLDPEHQVTREILLAPGTQYWLLPTLIVAVATLVGAWLFLGVWRDAVSRTVRIAVLYVAVTYWITTLAFVFFTAALTGRYTLHVHSVGYLAVALVVVLPVSRAVSMRDTRRISAYGVLASALTLVIAFSLFSRTMWRMDHPVLNPDYHAAMSFVAANHVPGQPVIVALPPHGYLGVDEANRDDVYFLAGAEDSHRAESYSRITEDGTRIDYWIGAETIVTPEHLRRIFKESPNALLVIDTYRLNVDWAYGGELEEVIRELTRPVYEGSGGVLVMSQPRVTDATP